MCFLSFQAIIVRFYFNYYQRFYNFLSDPPLSSPIVVIHNKNQREGSRNFSILSGLIMKSSNSYPVYVLDRAIDSLLDVLEVLQEIVVFPLVLQ